MDKIKRYSDRYWKKIIDFNNSLNSLNLNGNQDITHYFQEIGKIQFFDSLFGYDGYFQSINNSLNRNGNGSVYSFSNTLKNIFSRRLFFYLSKYKEETSGTLNNQNLDMLISTLSSYRRKEKIPFREERKILNSLDPYNPFALAPFYETFVDSELFTTLILISHPDYSNYKNSLLEKLQFIISSYINQDLSLGHSGIYDSQIKDEANIFWGLRVLVKELKNDFNLKEQNLNGTTGFERLITSLLECPINKRQFPNQNDLILEITPEINTLERTNLYIAINLLEIISLDISWNDNFKKLIGNKVREILDKYILSVPVCENLYFQCLKYRCCINYIENKENVVEKIKLENTSKVQSISKKNNQHSNITIVDSENVNVIIGDSNITGDSNIINEVEKLEKYISAMSLKEFEKLDLIHNIDILKNTSPEKVKSNKEYGKRVIKSLDFVNNVFKKSTEIYEYVKPILSTVATMFGINFFN